MKLNFFNRLINKNPLVNPHARLKGAHLFIILIVIINMLLFTHEMSSFMLQGTLILFLWLHDRDYDYFKKKLDVSNEQLKTDKDIFERNVIVSETDLEGIITYVNPKFCEITGYSKEELIGKPHNILRNPETSSDFYKKLWQTIENGETFHAEFKNIKKDGTPFWVDSSISPITHHSKIIGYTAIRFDIIDQVLAKNGLKKEIVAQANLLQEQRSRFEFAINSSRDGFWDYDIANQEFYLNSGWKKRLGFDENEKLSYLNYLSLIPDEHRFEHHKAMHDVIEEYPNELKFVHFRIQYPLRTKNGEKLLIDDVGDAFFDEEGIITRITGFHRDITDQERQAKMIESQNRISAMGEMIGNIAHQWRQPISAINNVLNDLEFDIELEDKLQIDANVFLETSSKVKEYTQYLSQTIDDFRKISSDEKIKTTFCIKVILNEAYNIVQTEYEKYNIKFQIIENVDYFYEFYGYPRELKQVILNILKNAKDVIVEKNIVNPQVLITLTRKKDNVTIIIHDNAGGIPQAIMDKIFDPYFTTKHESVGTGIGLYMSKKIIMEHFNGTLIVENENEGAKFIIILPKEVS